VENLYSINVNEMKKFNLSKEEVEKLDVIKDKKNIYHILFNDKAYKAELLNADFHNKQYTIRVNSNIYHLKLSNSLDIQIEKMGFSNGTEKQINEIKAPIPGIIIDVNVKEGDEIKEGEPLLVLEAMKMENNIPCHRDAVIKKVLVEKGSTVEKGKLLIELG